jgi:hypothetical protein
MAENKKTKMIVVMFLLIIVAVSALAMMKLYKAQSAQTGTVKITR